VFTGPDPAIRAILNGILAAAAALYALGTIAVIVAIRAEPLRARSYARLTGVAKVAALLVGLASLGSVIDAIDFRPEHEADLFAKWPALLPQVALLSTGAGFLTGLLAGARPVWVALAAGGPMTVLSLLVGAVTGWFLVATGWREGLPATPEFPQAVPQVVWDFFTYLALFPVVAIAASAAGASVGRWLHGPLGLPADEQRGDRAPAAATTAATVPTVPSSYVPEVPGPTSPAPSLPASAPHEPGPAPGWDLPPLVLPRRVIRPAAWPTRLLMALGVLMAIPSACGLLMERQLLTATDPAGGVSLASPPSDVTLTFSDDLSPSSRISVHRTVTLDETGRQQHTGGRRVADASGSSALSVDRRSLRVRLPDRLPGGLYVVEWTTVRARDSDERHGDLYFGVRMPVPRSIRDGGASRERDPSEPDRRETLVGGILAILTGLAWRWYARELQGG